MDKQGWRIRATAAGIILAGAGWVYWFAMHRADGMTLSTPVVFVVSSEADSGPGSLRVALFAMAGSQHRATIHLRTARIELENPLPPVTGTHGFKIIADASTVIDATRLTAGPVLDVQASNVELEHFAIEHSVGTAVSIRGDSVSLRQMRISGAAVAVEVIAKPANLSIRDSTFTGNRVALQSQGAIAAQLEHNIFQDNAESALSVIAPSAAESGQPLTLRLANNTFNGNRDSLVLANVHSELRHNRFNGSTGNAVWILGGETVITGNTLARIQGTAILLDGALRVRVTDNEIMDCAGIGVMARAVLGGQIERNNIDRNGYGFVQVRDSSASPLLIEENVILAQHGDGMTIIGASPLIRRNRILNSGSVGIRMLTLKSTQGGTPANPLLDRNALEGNLLNVLHGDYR